MSNITTEVENIAEAVSSCDTMAESHTYSAKRILSIVFMLTFMLMAILITAFIIPTLNRISDNNINIPDAALYVFLAIYVLTFGVLMSIYRLHVGEASRLQHYKVGFMRIRVAGSNTSPGYQSEVRTALTKHAFDFSSKSDKKEDIESPIPGHPGSDLATAVANKVFKGIEVVKKSRKPRAPRSRPEVDS
jgi:glucan phosphoethanolaminetransferase (alkaline phosphatase superfamily)